MNYWFILCDKLRRHPIFLTINMFHITASYIPITLWVPTFRCLYIPLARLYEIRFVGHTQYYQLFGKPSTSFRPSFNTLRFKGTKKWSARSFAHLKCFKGVIMCMNTVTIIILNTPFWMCRASGMTDYNGPVWRCVSDENDVSSSDNNALSNTGDDNDDTASEAKAEDPRNKRFLFNLRGGGGGGSGNFLFDLIRVSVYISIYDYIYTHRTYLFFLISTCNMYYT